MRSHGAILRAYIAGGGPLGNLGYPTSDEHDSSNREPAGRSSDFQHGLIFWDSSTGETYTILNGQSNFSNYQIIDGIDVSQHQGSVNWNDIATKTTSDGTRISFAYIRATIGDRKRDKRFAVNWSRAHRLLPCGPYHFFYARKTVDDTYTQVENFCRTIEAAGGPGKLPPMVDVEKESFPAGVTKNEAIQSLQFFLSKTELWLGHGQRPLIYTYPSVWVTKMGNTSHFANSYKLWIAHYGADLGGRMNASRKQPPAIPGGWDDCTIWQHAINRGVPGVPEIVDRDWVGVPSHMELATFLSE